MGINDIAGINETLVNILPPDVLARFNSLIFLSKIALWVFIGYIVFLIVRAFFGWRRNRRIDKIYHKINDIDNKLNVLLAKKHNKGDKINKKHKK